MKKTILIFSVLMILVPNVLFSQSSEPLNSNYLIEHGVSPRVLDAAASSLIQDGSFHQNLEIIEKSSNGEERIIEMELIYDPEYKHGMDILYVVDSDDLSKKEKKEYANYISTAHHFSRMTKPYLYDESTLKIIKEDGDEVVLEYYYKKQDIDPYLKFIKRLKGQIYFKKGELDRVVLTNIKPLKKKVEDFKYTVKFVKPENTGGHIVSSTQQTFKRTKGGEIFNYEANTITTSYKTADGMEVDWEGREELPEILKDVQKDTISHKLGWVLPFLGKPATKLGYKLPRPVGLNIFMHYQIQNMQFTALSAGLNDEEPIEFGGLFALDSSSVEQSTLLTMVKADVWILPFLNIMGIVGKGTNNVKGSLLLKQDLKEFLELIGVDPNEIPDAIHMDSNLNSIIYGGGATLAGGVGNWNLSVNYQLIFAKILEANTINMANVITPMVGYMFPMGLNLMAGAQGQFYDTKINGFINLENGDRVNYNVDFEPSTWNAILGIYKGFAQHLEIAIQAGFGDRTSLTVLAGYRF